MVLIKIHWWISIVPTGPLAIWRQKEHFSTFRGQDQTGRRHFRALGHCIPSCWKMGHFKGYTLSLCEVGSIFWTGPVARSGCFGILKRQVRGKLSTKKSPLVLSMSAMLQAIQTMVSAWSIFLQTSRSVLLQLVTYCLDDKQGIPWTVRNWMPYCWW